VNSSTPKCHRRTPYGSLPGQQAATSNDLNSREEGYLGKVPPAGEDLPLLDLEEAPLPPELLLKDPPELLP